MKLSITKHNILFLFLFLPFIAMTIPVIFSYGDGNLFLMDYLAKRLMTIITLPLIAVICVYSIYRIIHDSLKIKLIFFAYASLWLFYLVRSIFHGNQLGYLFVDAFVAILPLIFYFPVSKFNIDIDKRQYVLLLYAGYVLTAINVKLQFSYFNLIAVVYLIFIAKIDRKNLLLLALLPFVLKNALLGKSALIMLIFLVSIFFLKKYDFITASRKRNTAILLIVAVLFGSVLFEGYISETGSYRHFTYFLSHANFLEFEFNDASTGNRLFEAQKVIESFSNSNVFFKLFGTGFGGVIDLSDTMDATVINANKDPSKVHHIHIGFFAVLYRYGVIGLVVYFAFLFSVITKSKKILKNSNNVVHILSAMYLLIICFDSFISFPHMMSNFMFWISCAIVFYPNNTSVESIVSDKYSLVYK